MRKGKYIFMFVLLVNQALSDERDSLFRALNTAKHDSSKYKAFVKIGDYYQSKNFDSALYYHGLARQCAERMNDVLAAANAIMLSGFDHYNKTEFQTALSFYAKALKVAELFERREKKGRDHQRAKKLKASCLANIGSVYSDMGDYDKTLNYYFTALRLQEELGYTSAQAGLLNNMATVYLELGDHAESEKLFKRAIELSGKGNDSRNLALSLTNLGSLYYDRGLHARALENFYAALKLFVALNDTYYISALKSNIGIAFMNLRDHDKALATLLDAKKMNEQTGNKMVLSDNLNNIAGLYIIKNKFDRALEYLEEAKAVSHECGYKVGESHAYFNLGDLYKKTGDYQKAEESYRSCLSIAKKLGDIKNQAFTLANLGELHIRKKNYSAATDFLDEAKTLCSKIPNRELRCAVHHIYFSLYEETGRPAEALHHLKLKTMYLDSIAGEENTRRAIQQEFKFNYEKKYAADSVAFAKEKQKKDNHILEQNAELKAKRNQQWALAGGLALVVVFSGFLYNRFKTARRQKGIIEEQKKIVEQKQKEILDSIHYAKRIQSSLLASEKYIEKAIVRLNSNGSFS